MIVLLFLIIGISQISWSIVAVIWLVSLLALFGGMCLLIDPQASYRVAGTSYVVDILFFSILILALIWAYSFSLTNEVGSLAYSIGSVAVVLTIILGIILLSFTAIHSPSASGRHTNYLATTLILIFLVSWFFIIYATITYSQ